MHEKKKKKKKKPLVNKKLMYKEQVYTVAAYYAKEWKINILKS